jgi:WD40 repeat protein
MKQIFPLILLVVAYWGVWGQAPRLVVPIGHLDKVTAVAFSPDGKYILTGGSSLDKTVKLWDFSGRQILTLIGHTFGVTSVVISPDGLLILTGSNDHTAKLWTKFGSLVQSFDGHVSSVNSVAFSPDGQYILTGSNDKTAKLWTLSGILIQSFEGHASSVNSVAFSPNGQYVLTGSSDQTAKIWNLTGKEIHSFAGNTGTILSVAFSPDGQHILTGCTHGTADLWDLSGLKIHSFDVYMDVVSSVTFSPDGKYILTGTLSRTVKLWDLSGRQIQSFEGHAPVAFSPNGQYLMTSSSDNNAKLWDLSGHLIQSLESHSTAVMSVAFSPDSRYILMGTGNAFEGLGNNTAKLWDLSRRQIHSFATHTYEAKSMVFSPDSKYILTGSEGPFESGDHPTAKLWDLLGHQIQLFKGHSKSVTSVAFSPDGKYVLTGSWDGTAELWDVSGRPIQSFASHHRRITSVAFSPTGQYIVTTGDDNKIKLWDLSGHQVQIFPDNTINVTSMVFSPDGQYVLTGNVDKTAKLWNSSGHQIQSFSGHSGWVTSVAFSPPCLDDPKGGKYIVTGSLSLDKTAKLWDLSGNLIRSFTGHTHFVESATFSPNGKYVLTGSDDETAKLWDAKSGQELATLISINSNDWVVTSPSGLFDASPGAMKLMYYVQSLDVIDLDQLKERYYEPGLLAKIMGFDKSELRNVAAFDKVALYPEIKANITKDQLAIELTERNGGQGKLSLFINGKEVEEDINPKRLKKLNINLNTFDKYYQPDTESNISLRAYNQEGWLKSQAYELSYRPITPPSSKNRPSLFALVVGTSNYAGDNLDLRFADQDAMAMSIALSSTGSALFGADHTEVHLLSTTSPSETSNKHNIRQAFTDIATKASPADVLVVYFSGHGLAYGPAEKEQFYYLTKDIGSEDLSDPVVRDNYTISSNEFTQWLTAIPAQKQVMILDACNAGKVVESLAALAQKQLDPSQIRALDRMKDRTGMFILTGSAADKVSYEASQYGQGLLTYSLLQGMSGLALTEDKRVDVMTLFQYARDRVPELAKGIGGVQTPVLAFPAGGASFDIGIVNARVKIPVAQEKPVFIRNVFQDEASFDDVLGLTDALEKHFREITAKGAQATIIYVDVKEYENAYSMKGLYKVTGDAVEVRGRLFKGKESKGEFQVRGEKSDVPGLVTSIINTVVTMIK